MTLLALFVDKTETQLTIYFGHVHRGVILGTIPDCAGCSNATSVTLNENIVLFGHDIDFK